MVQIKRKVTIREKVTQEETPAIAPVPDIPLKKKTVPESVPFEHAERQKNDVQKGRNGKPWLWVIAIAVLAAIVFIGYRSGSSSVSVADDNASVAVTDIPDPKDENPTDVEKQTGVTDTGMDKEDGHEGDREADSDNNASADEQPVSAMPSENETVSSKEKTFREATPAVRKESSVTEISDGSVDGMAKDVIRGVYGNGQARKEKLGTSYSKVQGRVNEMYRQGLVH